MTSIPKRGRPVGTGINDDASLMKIAGLIVAGLAGTYEKAAAMVYKTDKPKHRHERKSVMARWRGKWGVSGQEMLEKVRNDRVRVIQNPTPVVSTFGVYSAELKQILEDNPVNRLKETMKTLGLDMTELQAMGRRATETLRDPSVQDALRRFQSGEIQAAMAEFRKYQS